MIPLYKPYIPDNLLELEPILYSGALAYGKWGRLFEQSLKEYIECDEDVLTVSSFTATIQVVLTALGIRNGDEIIASPQSCLASTQPIVTYGAKVVWADIDPNRGTLCPQSVESKITPRTKVIFHNHHCSYPGYIDEINSLGKKYGLVVVDDCIESFGSIYKGKKLGNVGTDITIFSFQTVRLPNTIDGGAIVFRERTLYENACKIRDLGVDRKTFRDSYGEINPASDVSLRGYGFTMNEISSYIGFNQMLELSRLFDIQRSNALVWISEIQSNYSQICLLNTAEIVPSYWIFGVLANNKKELLNYFRDLGYSSSGVHIPNTYYSIFGHQGDFPGVNEFYNKFVALPCGWWFNK